MSVNINMFQLVNAHEDELKAHLSNLHAHISEGRSLRHTEDHRLIGIREKMDYSSEVALDVLKDLRAILIEADEKDLSGICWVELGTIRSLCSKIIMNHPTKNDAVGKFDKNLLEIILSKTSYKDVRKLATVSKNWHDASHRAKIKIINQRELRIPVLFPNLTANEALDQLLKNPHYKDLQYLNLTGLKIDESAIKKVVSNFPNLKTLVLGFCELAENHMVEIANSEMLTNLDVLSLFNNNIGPKGCEVLFNSIHLKKLSFLNVGSNNIGDEGVEAFVNSNQLNNIKSLRVENNGIREGLKLLATSKRLKHIEYLDCSDNYFDDDSVVKFSESKYTTKLKTLVLFMCIGLTSDAAKAIAKSKNFPELTHLNLGDCGIDAEGVKALVTSTTLPKLKEIELLGNPIKREDLADLPYPRKIRLNF